MPTFARWYLLKSFHEACSEVLFTVLLYNLTLSFTTGMFSASYEKRAEGGKVTPRVLHSVFGVGVTWGGRKLKYRSAHGV